jgi:hypothetical protein
MFRVKLILKSDCKYSLQSNLRPTLEKIQPSKKLFQLILEMEFLQKMTGSHLA